MLKKIGLSAAGLVAMVALLAPAPASARVRFGVTVGTAPYAYPVDPYYGNGYYPDPYANGYYPDYYNYPAPAYVAPAPTYVAPYYSFGWGGHDRHEWAEHERHERHEFREHDGGYRGWGRR